LIPAKGPDNIGFWEWIQRRSNQRQTIFHEQKIGYRAADSFRDCVPQNNESEFYIAIKEGQKIGATIVLGDCEISERKGNRLLFWNALREAEPYIMLLTYIQDKMSKLAWRP
jgi:hypothetical protein